MNVDDIYTTLHNSYGDLNWWPANTPYEVIVGAILTQNTAWSNVEKAIANFGEHLSPELVEALPINELIDLIRPAGFFNQKAVYLKTLTTWYKRYDYSVETVQKYELSLLRKELLTLKGVGAETADSILLYAFDFPTFVVDSYTKRLLSRLGISVKLDYNSIKALFEDTLPPDTALYNNFHALIVINAKEHCKAKPQCTDCPLENSCAYGLK